jgi:hypothetical protein
MSDWRENEVWSEREVGDFEACVATSYAMGLLYGGVDMAQPYTQAERERLEVTFNEPQNLPTTDTKAQAVYGAKLRPPAAGISKTAFLARPGVGYCLTGTGSPLGLQPGTFIHEVFGVALTREKVMVYDPLARPGSPPAPMTVTALAAWMKGVADHQVREIRKDELTDMSRRPGSKGAGAPIGTFTMRPGHSLINPTNTAQVFPQPAGGTFDVIAVLDLKTFEGQSIDIDGHSPARNDRDKVFLVDAPHFDNAAFALRHDGAFTPAGAPSATGNADEAAGV